MIGFVVEFKHPSRFDLTLEDFVDDMDDLHTPSILKGDLFGQHLVVRSTVEGDLMNDQTEKPYETTKEFVKILVHHSSLVFFVECVNGIIDGNDLDIEMIPKEVLDVVDEDFDDSSLTSDDITRVEEYLVGRFGDHVSVTQENMDQFMSVFQDEEGVVQSLIDQGWSIPEGDDPRTRHDHRTLIISDSLGMISCDVLGVDHSLFFGLWEEDSD